MVAMTTEYLFYLKEKFCRGGADGLFCWPSALSSNISTQICPVEYFGEFLRINRRCRNNFLVVSVQPNPIYRLCLENGTWLVDPDTGSIANIHSCKVKPQPFVSSHPKLDHNVSIR